MLATELPHLPQRQMCVVIELDCAIHRCPPPLAQAPTSGLLLLHVELPHFEHCHPAMIYLLKSYTSFAFFLLFSTNNFCQLLGKIKVGIFDEVFDRCVFLLDYLSVFKGEGFDDKIVDVVIGFHFCLRGNSFGSGAGSEQGRRLFSSLSR
jgi:hypothetical protein